MTEIKQSVLYDSFKKLNGNRQIDLKNLGQLVESIKKQNNLPLHPVIVNTEMYVIDGQHRLEAAKLLNVPIYYIVSTESKDEDIYKHLISVNVNQKKWSLEDFFHLYAEKYKNLHYQEFLDLMKLLGLRPKGLIGLLFGPQTSKLIEEMKNGELKMPQNKEISSHICNSYFAFKEFVEARKIKPLSMFTTHHFSYAFRMLLLNGSCDIKTFFSKLENRWFELQPKGTAKDYFNMLISIYNWKNGNKIENAA